MATQSIVTIPYPETYDIHLENESLDSLYSKYADEILISSQTSEVTKAFVNYVNTVVEPVGWNAIWRSTKKSSNFEVDLDFFVEVLDVSMDSLDSTVQVLEVINCPDFHKIPSEELEQVLKATVIVPLIELYPIKDKENQELIAKTASAIEHIRFFYNEIWRPWDEDDLDDDEVFVEKHLRTRLKFTLDKRNNVLPKSVGFRSSEIISQGLLLRLELNSLHDSMHLSDSETEYTEDDVAQSIQIRLQMEDLQREMEKLENPLVRAFALKGNQIVKIKRNYSVNHLVGEKITGQMINELDLNGNECYETHKRLEDALANVIDGDTVYLYPGTHSCVSFGWIEANISITGVDKIGPVTIQGIGDSDVFLNIAAKVSITSLILKPESQMKSTLVIHKDAELKMNKCSLEGSNNVVLVLENAKGIFTESEIHHSKEDGIVLSLGGLLRMESSTVHNCGGNGIKIIGNKSEEKKSFLQLENSRIYANKLSGVSLTSEDKMDTFEKELDWSSLLNFPWLDIIVDPNSDILSNEKGAFSILNITGSHQIQSITSA